MSYKSETISEVKPRLNESYLLPAMQREFVWTEAQVCKLFDSLMRQYPISSFLFWQVPAESRDDVEAYEFLYNVKESGNRAQMARIRDSRDITFVLDGQQRLTALLVGLEGTYSGRRAKSGKGARTPVPKKLFLDLLHDGRCPDADGETYYRFEFFEYTPMLTRKGSYWFEVKRILSVERDRGLRSFIDDQISVFKNVTGIKLSSDKADIFEHNLTRLYHAIWSDDAISYYMATDSDHERILEIFVRANSGGTWLSRSDLLLSTLTLHWGSGNAREEINEFVNELNTGLTRKNRLNKDFVMKSCLVLLDFQVAYRVSSFNKETCARIRDRWGEIKRAIRLTVDAANAFGIDEENLTSVNALIPVAYYLFQNPRLNLRGESAYDVANAKLIRVWLISALLNHVLGSSSDSMLAKLREALRSHSRPNGYFPIAALDDVVRATGRVAASSEDSVEKVLETTYGQDTCFLALTLLYDDKNWGTITHSIDHLFAIEAFKRGQVPDHLRPLRNDFANLALLIDRENSGKRDKTLNQWLSTRHDDFLKRHCIPADHSLWELDNFENFLVERRKLLRSRLQTVLASAYDDGT